MFKLYAHYCSTQRLSTSKLKQYLLEYPALKQYLHSMYSKPICRSLRLEDFLIQPLQRLCKYPLLLEVFLNFLNIFFLFLFVKLMV
jgi:hypothetical protein